MIEPGDDPHVAAILDRIRAHPDLADHVYDGPPDDDSRPDWYIAVYVGSPSEVQARYTGPRTQLDYTITTHSVGGNPAQARSTARMVAGQLTDHPLAVEGRACRPLTHPVGRPLERDTDTNPALWLIADQFDLTSDPA